ncbi:MAG: jacalin-like lectin, partial [Pseudomonadota bacterium]
MTFAGRLGARFGSAIASCLSWVVALCLLGGVQPTLANSQVNVVGNPSGASFQELLPEGARLSKIRVRWGYYINAFQFTTELNGIETQGAVIGEDEGGEVTIHTLDPDEYVTRVSGTYNSVEYLKTLVFHTNKRTLSQAGWDRGPMTYEFTVPSGYEFAGFAGRKTNWLTAIGLAARESAGAYAVRASDPQRSLSQTTSVSGQTNAGSGGAPANRNQPTGGQAEQSSGSGIQISNRTSGTIMVSQLTDDPNVAPTGLAEIAPGQTSPVPVPAGTRLGFFDTGRQKWVGMAYDVPSGAPGLVNIPYVAPGYASVSMRNAANQEIIAYSWSGRSEDEYEYLATPPAGANEQSFAPQGSQIWFQGPNQKWVGMAYEMPEKAQRTSVRVQYLKPGHVLVQVRNAHSDDLTVYSWSG